MRGVEASRRAVGTPAGRCAAAADAAVRKPPAAAPSHLVRHVEVPVGRVGRPRHVGRCVRLAVPRAPQVRLLGGHAQRGHRGRVLHQVAHHRALAVVRLPVASHVGALLLGAQVQQVVQLRGVDAAALHRPPQAPGAAAVGRRGRHRLWRRLVGGGGRRLQVAGAGAEGKRGVAVGWRARRRSSGAAACKAMHDARQPPLRT